MTDLKYHVNFEGVPGVCEAQEGNCKFGADAPHFGTENEAREAFEARNSVGSLKPVSGRKANTLPTTLELTVLDQAGYDFFILSESGQIIRSYQAKDLGKYLPPGPWKAVYMDNGKDSYAIVNISDNGSVLVESSTEDAVVEPLPTSKETQEKVYGFIARLDDESNEATYEKCKNEDISRISYLESLQGVRRILAQHDWLNNDGAFRMRETLEDMISVLEYDEVTAEEIGDTQAVNTVRKNMQITRELYEHLK